MQHGDVGECSFLQMHTRSHASALRWRPPSSLCQAASELHVAMAWFCTTAVYEQGPEDGGVWAYDESVEDDLLGAHTNRRRVHGRCGKAYVCIRRATWLMSHHLCWRTLILLSTQCLPVCTHCNLQ